MRSISKLLQSPLLSQWDRFLIHLSLFHVQIFPLCYCAAVLSASTVVFCALATILTRTVVLCDCKVAFPAPAFFTPCACQKCYLIQPWSGWTTVYWGNSKMRSIVLWPDSKQECCCVAVLTSLRWPHSEKTKDFQGAALLHLPQTPKYINSEVNHPIVQPNVKLQGLPLRNAGGYCATIHIGVQNVHFVSYHCVQKLPFYLVCSHILATKHSMIYTHSLPHLRTYLLSLRNKYSSSSFACTLTYTTLQSVLLFI